MKLIYRDITYSIIYIAMTDEVSAKKNYVKPKCPNGKLKTYCGECGGAMMDKG